jgi:hypothetical protein
MISKCYCVQCLIDIEDDTTDGLCVRCRTNIANGAKPIDLGGITIEEIVATMKANK